MAKSFCTLCHFIIYDVLSFKLFHSSNSSLYFSFSKNSFIFGRKVLTIASISYCGIFSAAIRQQFFYYFSISLLSCYFPCICIFNYHITLSCPASNHRDFCSVILIVRSRVHYCCDNLRYGHLLFVQDLSFCF